MQMMIMEVYQRERKASMFGVGFKLMRTNVPCTKIARHSFPATYPWTPVGMVRFSDWLNVILCFRLMRYSSMDEGLDKDDRFRMVEDEFLDMAKEFTQHLHAAEYQRLKKAARSQNAAVINSISRPISVSMPDETRRKVESVARAKKQAATVQGLLRKQGRGSGSDEDSDGNGGAWLGTALHGLMESPRKSTVSLTKIGKAMASTRATVGFDKSRPQKPFKNSSSPLQDLESFEVASHGAKCRKKDPGEFSDDDDYEDDLDAPIRSRSHPISDRSANLTTTSNRHNFQQNPTIVNSGTMKPSIIASSAKRMEDDIDDISTRISVSARERIAKRLEQARLRRVKGEQEAREKLEIIPMFLS